MASLQSSMLRGGAGGSGAAGRGLPSSTSKRSKQDEARLPEAYQQEKPPWRPPLHPASSDRGVPDLFPTKPGQPEDDMSQISVRKGFAPRSHVQNESFSAHDAIYARLAAPDAIRTLSSWMDEVVQRRRQLDRASVAPSQYKPPSRVTLNDTKLANYVKDLADPSVPLTRLSRSVPHGFRGEKLFEMLWAGGALPSSGAAAAAAAATSNYFHSRTPAASSASTPSANASVAATPAPRKSVDISRAVWFIRALGAAELSSLRNKSAATIIPEITSNLCTWMAKQIAELNLVQTAESSSTAAPSPAPTSPSTHLPRTPGAAPMPLSRSVAAAHLARTPSNLHLASSPSSAPAKEVCAVLQNEVDEERWVAKWSYSLSLARHLHAQSLLDRSTLVRWIVDAFAASNLVQLPFLLELVQEVLVLILRRRCFAKPFLTALLVQISNVDARLNLVAGGGLRTKLVLLFRIVCENSPDSLISARLWSEHAITLTQLLNETNSDAQVPAPPHHVLEFVEQAVRPRVDRLLLRSQTSGPENLLSLPLQQHVDVQALDSFDIRTIDRVFLLNVSGSHRHARHDRDDAVWVPRIETILTWACTDRRSGVVRQYLAATLIEKIRFGVSWEESSEESDQVSLPAFDLDDHSKKTRKINVEPMLIKWLGDVETSLNQKAGEASDPARSTLLATVDVSAIVVLVGELARRGVFSYTKYLQRLIARGMTTAPSSGSTEHAISTGDGAPAPAATSRDSLHLRLLRSLPLYDQPASVYQQRKQAIYGDRTKETYEDAAQRRALRQLQSFLPFAFAQDADAVEGSHIVAPPPEASPSDLEKDLSRLWSASRFVRCRLLRNELLPAVTARVESLNGEQLSQVSAVLVAADDFEGLAQLLASLLLRPLSDSIARAAFNMVIEHSLVWRSMDILGTLKQLVRQQLNHSSSVRNDRQAVMASTTLLRLRTLIERLPPRVSAPALETNPEHDAMQQHVQALRPNVDALLDRFAKLTRSSSESSGNSASASSPVDGSDMLTPFRSLFVQADATCDEMIERAIVESVLACGDVSIVPAAVRLIDQLYLEASLEIDERHARWLSHLVVSIEQGTHSDACIRALLHLLTRLIAHGTLNLQLAMDAFLLPYTTYAVRRLTDPATRGADATLHLGAAVSSLGDMFASLLGEMAHATSYEDSRAFGAQTTLLFARDNLPSLLRLATCLICASDEPSALASADKTQIESFWRALLRSEPMHIAFRQDPRLCLLTVKDTCKSMWGCNPSRVIDLAIACLDPTSLLLRDVATIDAASVKSRLDAWYTAVVANELVEIFERLQLVESSFQSRADSKTKALASGIFDDLFVRLPDIGAQLVRDCHSSGLVSRFTDIGIKLLSDRVKAAGASETKPQQQLDSALDGDAPASVDDGVEASSADEREVESTLRSVLRMCEQQDGFVFNATDADSCGQLLLHVIASLEAALGQIATRPDDDAPRLSALLQDGMSFPLLHLVLRFGCLWSGAMRTVALRLVKVLFELLRRAGEKAQCGGTFALLLDSLNFVLDELPPQLLGACLPELEMQLQTTELATHERTEKLRQLSCRLDDASTAGGWFVAPSAGAAVKKGWFTPGGLNPWECAEYLDAPPAAAASGGAAGNAVRTGPIQSRGAAAAQSPAAADGDTSTTLPGARTGWISKLSLNTAIPSYMLGLRVTRDLVPHYASPASPGAASIGSNDASSSQPSSTSTTAAASTGNAAAAVSSSTATTAASAAVMDGEDALATLPIFVESERTYGERTAGEPVFSRDLRRGLLVRARLPRIVANEREQVEAAPATEESEAIQVIDLTWDDDEMPLHEPQSQNGGSGMSRKRRLSKRDA
ncbi:RNA polymerase II mediator [Pseudozyma hubeiensis SY62]|uniref:Mediator of RNA polymerase II transcription subunit 12 n=1 Tax=Pseudozyma hubeiensis (strain SY62) TaxID=1305764 RepID=R9P342_PSEHS|nr:RNA polymerase II mediator [Pseudozyma hubeiensis SY62]GAC95724.1 RNA polymerase II mediator [Pseudozyma hubeiensis SY62]